MGRVRGSSPELRQSFATRDAGPASPAASWRGIVNRLVAANHPAGRLKTRPQRSTSALPHRRWRRRIRGPENFDDKGMHSRLEFGIERVHYRPVLLQARFAGKLAGRDSDTKVGFACLAPAGVPCMAVRLVDDLQLGRRKALRKFVDDDVAG